MKTNILFIGLLWALVGCVTSPETGKTAFVVTSEDQEAQLGEQAFQEVLKKERVSNNAKWNAVLQRVGQRIAAQANRPDFKWEFKLIESKDPNAFCLPGGKVAFYTGIFPVLQTEAAMAAVMGHEVAHATLRHGGQRMTATMGSQLGLQALSMIVGGPDSTKKNLLFAALGAGLQVGALLPFSRGHESEADQVGLVYMAKAGYDPAEAVSFWDRFGKAAGGAPPKFLSTHPPSAERKQALEGQLPGVAAHYQGSPKYGAGERL